MSLVLSITLVVIIPLWLFFAISFLTDIPSDFSYSADVFSTDNFYDPETGVYSGVVFSKTNFFYEVRRHKDNILILANVFDVRTPDGEKIFAVERLYGIDRRTGKHVAGEGDNDRTGYLFAPKGIKKGQNYTYWHINYDVPAEMQFIGEEQMNGITAYVYEANYSADQTNDLRHLPGVPEERGVELDINLKLWVEPTTGYLIKYEDNTTAYYYNISTKERIHPWNQFHNEYSEISVKKHTTIAEALKLRKIIYRLWVPVTLAIAAFLMLLWSRKIKHT